MKHGHDHAILNRRDISGIASRDGTVHIRPSQTGLPVTARLVYN